ncbi:MAG: hypothetical protein ACLQPD_28880 [Desulfomonilaceae bacterium]
MNDQIRPPANVTADVQVPFSFTVMLGEDPSRRSHPQKTVTRSLSLMGLVFESPTMEPEGFHLSFTPTSFSQNLLEITLNLGKKFPPIEVLGQVDWNEKRSTVQGHSFLIGVSFIDLQPDALVVLRQFLQTAP